VEHCTLFLRGTFLSIVLCIVQYHTPRMHCVQTSWCGDGIVDNEAGEECDDANDNDHDNCTGQFQLTLMYKTLSDFDVNHDA